MKTNMKSIREDQYSSNFCVTSVKQILPSINFKLVKNMLNANTTCKSDVGSK